MLKSVEDGKTYLNVSGDPFKVVGHAKHGYSKGGEMIVYQNLTSTETNPVMFSALVLTKAQFMKSFKEVPSND